MATLHPGDIPLVFGGQAPAAAPAEAALWPAGLANATTIDGYRLPDPGAIVGISVVGAPASGDTLAATARVNTANVVGVTATVTNAAPTASAVKDKDADTSQLFNAGDIIRCRYQTTTTSVYTARDTLVVVWVRPFRYP